MENEITSAQRPLIYYRNTPDPVWVHMFPYQFTYHCTYSIGPLGTKLSINGTSF